MKPAYDDRDAGRNKSGRAFFVLTQIRPVHRKNRRHFEMFPVRAERYTTTRITNRCITVEGNTAERNVFFFFYDFALTTRVAAR